MLSPEERRLLLDLARRSIAHGVARHSPLPVVLARFPQKLRQPGASFVTLEKHGQLRGCIGMLEAVRPLAEDVAQNAYAAAFCDPRFPCVEAEEVGDLEIHISVLSEPVSLTVASEEDLVAQLRPGIDGLILQEGARRATFLPSVWETLPDPRQFVEQLKLKAGFPRDYWSPQMRVFIYQTEQFG